MILFSILFALASSSISAPNAMPVELGKVPWLRNYDEALAQARKTKKPILVLFQEVPG
jgi:hypothetical protein